MTRVLHSIHGCYEDDETNDISSTRETLSALSLGTTPMKRSSVAADEMSNYTCTAVLRHGRIHSRTRRTLSAGHPGPHGGEHS